MQVMTFKKEKREGRKKRETNGDRTFAVTVLSRTAVTSLLVYNQMFKCEYVTGDSNFYFLIP